MDVFKGTRGHRSFVVEAVASSRVARVVTLVVLRDRDGSGTDGLHVCNMIATWLPGDCTNCGGVVGGMTVISEVRTPGARITDGMRHRVAIVRCQPICDPVRAVPVAVATVRLVV